jgi:hypothetical protein
MDGRVSGVFPIREINRRKGGANGAAGGPCHPQARPEGGRAWAWYAQLAAPLPLSFWQRVLLGLLRHRDFVSRNSENIFFVKLLKYKNSRKLALLHIVNKLVPENEHQKL